MQTMLGGNTMQKINEFSASLNFQRKLGRKFKMSKKTICFVLFILLIANASALGITPGRVTINFKPGMETEIPFSVINNEHKSMEVALMVSMKSEMNSVITLQQNKLVFKSEEERKEVKYKVKLPDNLE